MASRFILPREKLPEEKERVTIEIELSAEEIRSVRRLLDGKYEPDAAAWLVVKVKKV